MKHEKQRRIIFIQKMQCGNPCNQCKKGDDEEMVDPSHINLIYLDPHEDRAESDQLTTTRPEGVATATVS